MRRRHLLGRATAAAAAAVALAAPACAVPRSPAAAAAPAGALPEVDVLLLLAADVSRSMDEEEARLQREGYVAALHDPEVQAAIMAGPVGAIALAFLEWSGPEHQRLVLPWTRIGGAAEARAFGGQLRAAPLAIGTWTAIGAALDRAREVVQGAPFAAARAVVDVSGDGSSNSGTVVEEARDRAVAAGIVINGLPVMRDPPLRYPGVEVVPLDAYYRDAVVGGAGAFVMPAEDFRSFGRAVRRKLVLEIAALPGGGAGTAAG